MQRITWAYRAYRGYRGLQEVLGGYKGLQKVTRANRK